MDLKITQDYLYHLLPCEAAFRYVARAVADVKKQSQNAGFQPELLSTKSEILNNEQTQLALNSCETLNTNFEILNVVPVR